MYLQILPDANVLYPRTLRDWLLMLQTAPTEIFTTCWVDILAEGIDDYAPGPDAPVANPFDRVAAEVDLLITSDKDFLSLPSDVVDRLPYEIWTPDDSFVLVDDQEPAVVHGVTRQQWDHWRRREPSSDLAQHLIAAGCPKFADRVREHIRSMR